MRKSRKENKIVLIGLVCLLVLAAGFVAGWLYVDNLAYKTCRVEAGVAVVPSDFLKTPDENAVFTEKSEPFDVTEPGEYQVKVKSGIFIHSCTLIVEDTVAPKGEAAQVTLEMGQTCEAARFVSNVTDATEVTVSYVTEPDFSKAGTQAVQVVLRDKGNNETVIDSELFLSQVLPELTVEAGGAAPGLEDFVVAGENAAFLTDVEALDYTQPGDHEISLEVDGTVYTSVLHIADTTPPEVEVHDVEGYALLPRTPEEFVTSIKDATDVTAVFQQEPDVTKIGTQELVIVFTDAGGNTTEKQVTLTLLEDTEPPVISGAADMKVYVGDSVSYKKNVTVTDNCPADVPLTVDSSGVNLEKSGVYPVTYTATDLAGNTTSVTVNVTVRTRSYSEAAVNELADAVLAKIITAGMTDRQKAEAIFNYVVSHVGYISHSEKGDYIRAAYEGLALGQGDCYVYASTSKVLLTRAGIKNMDIVKIPSTTSHYWNLVDVGDGWYHFDTTPRRAGHPRIFLWTEAELMEYSNAHNNSHNYDHSAYPTVN